MLSPALMARLESLQVNSRRRLVGRFGGDHDSKRYGSTIDFADFREYHPGDDFRRIDYHVLARLDQILIKLFEADDDAFAGYNGQWQQFIRRWYGHNLPH